MIAFDNNKSLDVILKGLFDYAGMFPPAQRSFKEALQESASFQTTLKRPWLVGSDFVLDTEHIRTLAKENLVDLGFNRTVSVCVLATEPLVDVIAAATALANTTCGNTSFHIASLEAKASVDTIEALLAEVGPYAQHVTALLAIEFDLSTERWRETLNAGVTRLQASPYRTALKCRATGPTGIGPERLAAAICASSDAGLSLKVTGGFHHPIVDPGFHTYPMGFLNLAAAVMFRRALHATASEDMLIELLKNASTSELSLQDGVHFRSLHISRADLAQAKAKAHFSIGSCSLHEPDDDLARLF